MTAGRELDALIAEGMGYEVERRESPNERYRVWLVHAPAHDTGRRARTIAPRYSSDMEAAWLVAEAMRARGFRWFNLGNFYAGHDHETLTWGASFHVVVGEFAAEADTAPLAICRAALLALASLPSGQPAGSSAPVPSEGPADAR
jgi:hypothetical protein